MILRTSRFIFLFVLLLLVVALPQRSSFAESADIERSLGRLRRLLDRPVPSYSWKQAQEIPFGSIIRKAAVVNAVEPSLLAALVRVESNFNPLAVSQAGAQGLGQLMPTTGRELGVVDPFDPQQNLAASSRYLAEQLRAFKSTPLALAAYNAGPARVKRGTVPASTWRYVKRVERIAAFYRARDMP